MFICQTGDDSCFVSKKAFEIDTKSFRENIHCDITPESSSKIDLSSFEFIEWKINYPNQHCKKPRET